ncbi:unnamed protein product [Linum trigynum]|uniref:Secreted protein n=1 Tax=Linum trigynum TaxID=586398 RepID=A0AAV2F490_9ROSI
MVVASLGSLLLRVGPVTCHLLVVPAVLWFGPKSLPDFPTASASPSPARRVLHGGYPYSSAFPKPLPGALQLLSAGR